VFALPTVITPFDAVAAVPPALVTVQPITRYNPTWFMADAVKISPAVNTGTGMFFSC